MNGQAAIYTSPEEEELLAGDALSLPFPFTVFPDTKARTKRGKRADLIALAKRVERTRRKEKSALPLVSLGRYGDAKSERGSLRHRENLREVHGLEADYDAGEIPPAEAARLLSEAGIAALIYTSPSHGLEDKGNRWRVVCPFSGRVSPDQRKHHVARLNGVLGGVVSRESFTLSQSYFIGGIGGREPEIFLVDGNHIDGLEDLDTGAVYAQTSESRETVSQPGDWPLEVLRNALCSVPADSEYEIWLRCLAAVHHETGGSKRGFAIADAWSACGDKWKAGEVRTKWNSFGDLNGALAAAGTLFHLARENGWEGPTEDFDDDFDDLESDDPSDADLDAEIARILGNAPPPEKVGGLTFITPRQCDVEARRDYVVKGLIGPGQIGCIFGDPGAGKSLLAPSIVHAVAQGRDTFGLRTKAGLVFYVAAEDETGMRGRIRALRSQRGEAEDFKLVGGASDLFRKDSPRLKALRHAVKAQRPKLIVIDTLAVAFPGLEENDAKSMGHVVAVARALTNWVAAVILVHHAPKAEGNTPRGHSLFNGALDMALHLRVKDQAGVIRGKLTKNRNGPCDLDIAFKIGVERFGEDDDGDPIIEAYAYELEPGAAKTTPSLSPTQRAVMAVFGRLANGAASVDRRALREAAMDDAPVSTSDRPASRKDTFNRALRGLEQKKVIDATPDQVTLIRAGADLTNDFDDLNEAVTDP